MDGMDQEMDNEQWNLIWQNMDNGIGMNRMRA